MAKTEKRGFPLSAAAQMGGWLVCLAWASSHAHSILPFAIAAAAAAAAATQGLWARPAAAWLDLPSGPDRTRRKLACAAEKAGGQASSQTGR